MASLKLYLIVFKYNSDCKRMQIHLIYLSVYAVQVCRTVLYSITIILGLQAEL